MIDLKGRVAVITGGSRGIGRETALLFAKANSDVAITYRTNDDAANFVVEQIKNMG